MEIEIIIRLCPACRDHRTISGDMVELVDTRRSERRGSNIVRVQIPLSPRQIVVSS